MEMIRTLIVDDELLARKRIRNLLRSRTDFEIVGECANGREAVAAIRQRAPDLVFLDVQMPDLDGFGVLRALGAAAWPIVVFVTAYDQYALRAFEVHALDYLLKPFDDERFDRTLAWARAQLQREQLHHFSEQMLALLDDYHGRHGQPRAEDSSSGEPQHLTRLMIKSAGRILFIEAEEIDWIEAEGCYACLHVGGKSYLLRETMSGLEAQLDPRRFLRIHRSAIVNLQRVKELEPQSHGEYTVILEDGTQLKLSRSYRDRLQALLSRHH